MRKSIKHSFYFLIGLLGFKALPALAATEMFLCSDEVAGESTGTSDGRFVGCIDVLAWSWGASQSGTFHTGAGGGAGKASFQDLSVTKFVDKSSPNLMSFLANGTILNEVQLINVNPCCDTPVEYYKINMTKLIVTSVSTGGSGGEDRLTENVTLNFAKFEYCYTQTTGKEPGAETCFEFDIAANAEP